MLNQLSEYLEALLNHPPGLALHLIHEPLDGLLNAVPVIPLPQVIIYTNIPAQTVPASAASSCGKRISV